MAFKCLKRTSMLVMVLMCAAFSPATAEEQVFSEQTVLICNKIIENVHSEIQNQKDEFEDLKLYTDLALKTNQWGFRYIKYQFIDTFRSREKDKLDFLIEFVPIDADKEYTFEGDHFEYDFPLLKIKLIAYQNRSNKSKQVKVLPFVKEHARPIHDYQSQFLPVKFSLSTEKESYQVGQTITLIVEMENLTSTNLKLRDLSSKSVAFTFDRGVWENDLGLADPKTGNEILRPHRTLKRKFRLRGVDKPQTLAVHAVYLMPFKNARPTHTRYIKITEE